MKRWAMLPAAAAIALIGLATVGSVGGAQGTGTATWPPVVLDASTTTPTESSILLAMGRFDDPSDTFWEVLLRPAGSTSWVLHTPPGVASNGGLALAASPAGPLMVGFMISGDLTFSPVAQSTNGGATWVPGELPSALTPTPDALAVAPTGAALALVATADQRILGTSGDLSAWHTLTSTRALARADPSCGVQEVTAVAYSAAAQPLLGLRCAHGGGVGVLTATATAHATAALSSAPVAWRDIGPSLGAGSGAATVTRLVRTPEGVAGLAQLYSRKRASIVGFWGNGSTTQWSGPSTFSVPAGWSVKATATGGGSGQGFAVLLGSGESRRVEVVAGQGAYWSTLPQAPRGASGVSDVGSEVDTFVVSGSHLVVWTWTAGAAAWRRSASITVPVPYGSSG